MEFNKIHSLPRASCAVPSKTTGRASMASIAILFPRRRIEQILSALRFYCRALISLLIS